MPGKHPFRHWLGFMCAFALLGVSTAAPAVNRDDPINIEADSAELKEDFSVYTGQVRLSQGAMVLQGDRLVVRKAGKGNYTLSLSGRPASIYQPPEGNNPEAIRGHANKIDYASGQEILELRGNASIDRGGEKIAGDTIRYNVQQRRTLVNNEGGTAGGRVKITLQPGK